MPSLHDLHTVMLKGVQEISAEPGLPTHTPFLAGYGQACTDLTTLLQETPLWEENRLDPDVLARAIQVRDRVRQRVLAETPETAPVPERAMAAGASGASGGVPGSWSGPALEPHPGAGP